MEKSLDEQAIGEYIKHTANNELEIVSSGKAGCLSCGRVFDAREVKEWDDSASNSISARCPHCGMATVVGDASGLSIDEQTIKAISEDPKAISRSHRDIYDFCDAYVNGLVEDSQSNESLFLKYCDSLYRKGDVLAAMDLGRFYFYGSKNTPADLDKAWHYFFAKRLDYNEEALRYRANLLSTGTPHHRRSDVKCAEALNKAVLLGSDHALFMLADLYDTGVGVMMDRPLALRMYMKCYETFYSLYSSSAAKFALPFAHVCYRLSNYFADGVMTGVNIDRAGALLTMADYLYSSSDRADEKFIESVKSYVQAFGEAQGWKKGQIVYDEDTFCDTMMMFSTPVIGQMTNISFSKDAGTLSFNFYMPLPYLAVDIGNMCCERIEDGVEFTFGDVEYADLPIEDGHFVFMTMHAYADEIDFFLVNNGVEEQTPCGRIKFSPSRNQPK